MVIILWMSIATIFTSAEVLNNLLCRGTEYPHC